MTRLVVERGGVRADRFLADALPGRGRRRIAEAFEAGLVRVNGRPAKKGQVLQAGDVVELAAEPPARADERPVPEAGPLEVLHEDRWLVAVGKPPGMPSHPLRAGERGTLANALVARWPECGSASTDVREAGLAHRLDAGTSGVMVAARDAETWRALRDAFAAGRVKKKYLALVAGAPPWDARDVDSDVAGQSASTHVVVAQRLGDVTLVSCETRTGRRHQVRVHLASLGLPIVGDTEHGWHGAQLGGLNGFFLHAESLAVLHPRTGKLLDVGAPLPPDRLLALSALGAR